jgi:hypothetical protein
VTVSETGRKLLYHYTGREAAFEHILPEHRLRLSSFQLMGDPLEFKDWYFGGPSRAALTRMRDASI